MANYCEPQDVLNFLMIESDNTNLTINTTQITSMIQQKMDYIDARLNHAFRVRYIKNEVHHIRYYSNPLEVRLNNREINTLNLTHATEPDKIQLLGRRGEYKDITDFNLDKINGVIYLLNRGTDYTALPIQVVVTYHFGENVIPGWCKELTAKLTAIHMLRTSFYKLPSAENMEDITQKNIDQWQSECEDTILTHQESITL